jgi:hypothetical protein
MREFVRHPSDIPMAMKVAKESGSRRALMCDVSMAGLSCVVSQDIPRGSRVEFFVPSLSDESSGRGTVMWCKPTHNNYHLGVSFNTEQDSFRTRMVEQVCQIEHYRQEVEELEGRILDSEEAAAEWIQRYAADFDRIFSLN